MHQIHRKRIFVFIALTCFLSWVSAGAVRLAGIRWNSQDSFIFLSLYMFMPSISALISLKLIFKERFREKLALRWKPDKWWLFAWLMPLFISLLGFGISLLMPGVSYVADFSGVLEQYRHIIEPEQADAIRQSLSTLPVHPFWISIVQGMLAGISINAVFALGEEAGWRGYLFHELQQLNFWKSSAFIGTVWGIWHFPVILMGHNYPMHPKAGVLFMVVMCVLLSPAMNLFRIKSGSVIPAAIFHGTFNGTAGLAIIMLKGGNDLTNGVTGLAGLIVLLGINLVIYWYYGKNPRFESN